MIGIRPRGIITIQGLHQDTIAGSSDLCILGPGFGSGFRVWGLRCRLQGIGDRGSF